MSCSVGAALKKVGVSLLTDKKVLKWAASLKTAKEKKNLRRFGLGQRFLKSHLFCSSLTNS